MPLVSFADTAQAGSGVLWSSSFSESSWKDAWKARASFGMNNLAVKSLDGSKFLRVAYPKYSCSPAYARSTGNPIGGGQFTAKPVAARDKMVLSYDVRFPVGFSFVKGGKLPGLFGGDGNTGGDIPNGKDGWTTRFMWRENGAGEVYAYLPTSKSWGTEIGKGNWHFKADGKFHRLVQEVKMNTPGKYDGHVKVWYDGKQVVYKGGLKFRTVTYLKVDGIMFSTFFGGQSTDWRTPKWQHVDYDNFKLSSYYSG